MPRIAELQVIYIQVVCRLCSPNVGEETCIDCIQKLLFGCLKPRGVNLIVSQLNRLRHLDKPRSSWSAPQQATTEVAATLPLYKQITHSPTTRNIVHTAQHLIIVRIARQLHHAHGHNQQQFVVQGQLLWVCDEEAATLAAPTRDLYATDYLIVAQLRH
jgi:hypothetical protein